MGIEEGTVARWLKAVGEKGDKRRVQLLRVETAKALQEVLAPISGTLVKIICGQGDRCRQ